MKKTIFSIIVLLVSLSSFSQSANDECETAIDVPIDTGGFCLNLVAGTIAGATPSALANPCHEITDDDVWFKFTATDVNHYITLSEGDSFLDLSLSLYTGSCSDLTLLNCGENRAILCTIICYI